MKNTQKTHNYPAKKSKRGIIIENKQIEKNWNTIEKYIADKNILPLVKNKKERKLMIDIGAGEGTYSKEYSKYFERTISIEPDKDRAKKISDKKKNSIKVINDKIENIKLGKNKADAVFCIHVLQHVSEKTSEIILEKSIDSLRKNGLLILGFTFKTKYTKKYNISWQKNKKYFFTQVPKEVFNTLAKDNIKGILPVKKINKNSLIKKISKKGMSLEKAESYMAFMKGKISNKINSAIMKFISMPKHHKILKKLKFDNFGDVILVFKKR